MSAGRVSEDLEMNHSRKTSCKLIQSLSAAVAQVAQDKEFEWEYALPVMESVVHHISVSRDGTTTPIVKEGYRETMCGTISFYNKKGDRMHTIYIACAPEYGMKCFEQVLDMEIDRVKTQYQDLRYIGLADGAKSNWTYLKPRVHINILDFFHAADYLTEVSIVMEPFEGQRLIWLENACHDLKNKNKGAKMILRELKAKKTWYSTSTVPEVLNKTITYFENNLDRMNYAYYQKEGYPIGSGVTEAACKVVAKQRLSNSGMRWTIPSAQNMLLLRGLICTTGRWQQFWDHIDKKGT